MSEAVFHPERPVYLFVLPWTLEHGGGVSQVVLNLAREMQRSGLFAPLLLVIDWHAPLPRWGQSMGIPMLRWRVRQYQLPLGIKEAVAYRLWEARFRPAFLRLCRRYGVAAVNVHYPVPAAFALERACAAAQPPLPLLLSFHGTDASSLQRCSPVQLAQWRALLQGAHGVVACSRALCAELMALFGDSVRPAIIHNGLDGDAFRALGGAPVQRGERIILSVGKFVGIKGQDVLIDAFAAIAADYPDARLQLVGAAGDALDSLRQRSARHGLAGRVQFLTDLPHGEVAACFSRAELFVLPSRRETFGIVLLEAGAFGLPVVATRIGGIPEVVGEGETARLVPPDDAPALAAAMRALLDAPEVARAMGARLQHHAQANFSWRAGCAAYAALVAAPLPLAEAAA